MKNIKEETIEFFEKKIIRIDDRLKVIRKVIVLTTSLLKRPPLYRLDLWLDIFLIKKDISSLVKNIIELKKQKKFFIEKLEELKNPWIQ